MDDIIVVAVSVDGSDIQRTTEQSQPNTTLGCHQLLTIAIIIKRLTLL